MCLVLYMQGTPIHRLVNVTLFRCLVLQASIGRGSSLHGCSASCGGAPCVSNLFAVSCSFWSCTLSVLPRRQHADMRVHGVESISSCFCCIPRVGCRWLRQGFFDSTVVSLCAGWGVILLANPPVTALVSRGLKQIPFSGPHSGYENVSPNSWVTFC